MRIPRATIVRTGGERESPEVTYVGRRWQWCDVFPYVWPFRVFRVRYPTEKPMRLGDHLEFDVLPGRSVIEMIAGYSTQS